MELFDFLIDNVPKHEHAKNFINPVWSIE